jgi:hypothetical protein
MKKNILDMTLEERQAYIKQKAINRVYNKLNNKFKTLEGLRYERV